MFRRRFGNIVDLMLAVGIGELLWCVVLNLGKDEGRERRGLRGRGGGTFREDRSVVRDTSAVVA